MPRAADSSQLLRNRELWIGNRIGVAFQPDRIGKFLDDQRDRLDAGIPGGRDGVLAGREEGRLGEANDQAARIQAELQLAGGDLGAQLGRAGTREMP